MASSNSSSPFKTSLEGGKVARQFSARSTGFVRFAVAITAVAMLASFALSFNAQMAIASMMGLPIFMQPLMPLGVDTFILESVCTLTILRQREGVLQRYDESGKRIKGLRPWYRSAQGLQWGLMGMWTALSAALNAFHGFDVAKDSGLGVQIALVLISVVFPIGVLTATETLMKILIEENTDSPELAAAKTRLINAGMSVAAQPAPGRTTSIKDQALDQQIVAAHQFPFDGATPTHRALAAQFSVTEGRVKKVLASMEQAA